MNMIIMRERDNIKPVGNGLVWISAGLHFPLVGFLGLPASLLDTPGVVVGAVLGKPGMDHPAQQLT